jgi:hypothetical protein
MPSAGCRVKAESGREMRENDPSNQIDFDAPATFRKWPSLKGKRRIDSSCPYLLLDGTLGECIQQFMAKPTATWHLYEIHTVPQVPFLAEVVTAENVCELAQLRDFLARAAAALRPPTA